ncbi:bifunctional demethylmenaquinone methyltransferase/2-methoxy-6-polyprenyl-1,4-benzoquinol methylase UbiE [Fimbriimonas ginsengisoli]|uniref:Demethylmenaquinone methyltransferase n=1 Tax=Fimbriimonas ginsengisoli Gsoil 348 TaxID=661478 RepID=A0A068NP71_FIMGI|nr:bifunctional demethylmenaquinone methyltransferase/2-methoxy-6-polyprenyl-1,4-benzoquinol methylase UbiE [Fimbriimonas ginsengisoli]AIE85241.1 SAM-dependent methyltransferase [Fimbriimonas ginsengisoli Gsoil 348]
MATQVEERIWTAEGARKRATVQQMFAEIAPTYDLLNGMMSFSLHHRWRTYAVSLLKLQPGDSALDVCCGTGDFLFPLRKAVGTAGHVAGVDFCAPMLARASEKLHANILALGDACQLPIAGSSVHGVTVGWGIRNVPDIDGAHREIARVLKPGGRFVSLDMARPRNRAVRAVSEFVFNSIVPRLGALFGKTQAYTYLPKSTQRFWTREQLAASMESAGMVEVGHRDLMFGNICIHYGRKADPGGTLGETRE